MSLLGDWTRTPGRRGAAARVVVDALEPRDDGRRDNVALLYLLALEGVADHARHGLVGIDRDDPDLTQVFGAGAGAVERQLVTHDQAVVGADGHLDAAVGGVDPLDLPRDRRRALHPFDLAD